MERIEFTGGYIIVAAVNAEAEHSPLLTESDHAHLETISSPTRRAQWATWRHVTRSELGAEALLRYNSAGAPLLERAVGEVAYISVSHSAEWVAVMFSHTRCGVDIEAIDRNFARVASRYITPEERATAEADFAEGVFEAVVWSAKEAIYKYGNTQGVDFTADLLLVGHNKKEHTIRAELYGVPIPEVHYLLLGNQVLCYLAG